MEKQLSLPEEDQPQPTEQEQQPILTDKKRQFIATTLSEITDTHQPPTTTLATTLATTLTSLGLFTLLCYLLNQFKFLDDKNKLVMFITGGLAADLVNCATPSVYHAAQHAVHYAAQSKTALHARFFADKNDNFYLGMMQLNQGNYDGALIAFSRVSQEESHYEEVQSHIDTINSIKRQLALNEAAQNLTA